MVFEPSLCPLLGANVAICIVNSTCQLHIENLFCLWFLSHNTVQKVKRSHSPAYKPAYTWSLQERVWCFVNYPEMA